MRLVLVILLLILLATTGFFVYRHFFSHPVVKKTDPFENPAMYGQQKRDSEESIMRGMAFLHQGDVGKAKYEFEDAIRIDSTNYRAYYNLGVIYRAIGELVRAEGYYRTTLTWTTRFYATWNNLANLKLVQNAPLDTVLFYINQATTAYPDCTDYVDTKIDALVKFGKMSEADSLWRHAFAKDSTHTGLLNKKPLFDAMRRTHR